MKPFLSIEQQIDLLKSRGLYISDFEFAYDTLLRINYYRLSGYSLTLRKNDVFYPGISFSNIVDIYSFDSILRNILLFYLGQIETSFKSSYAYYFSEYSNSGACYENMNYYTNFSEAVANLNVVFQNVKKSYKDEFFVKHHMENHMEFPIWVLIESFTFGNISRLYSITCDDVKRKISKHFGFPGEKGPFHLGNVIHCLSLLRNFCAHGSRLFNKQLTIKPSLSSKEKKLLRDPSTSDSGIWGEILMMRRLLAEKEFLNMIERIKNAHNDYPFVDLKYYQFPDNWDVLI